jgi:hypothetical protein
MSDVPAAKSQPLLLHRVHPATEAGMLYKAQLIRKNQDNLPIAFSRYVN